MRVGLIDIDGHNFPNLALMKLSAWHKARGDTVEMTTPDESEGFDCGYRDFRNNIEPTPEQKAFARWVNHKAIFKSVLWEDYRREKRTGGSPLWIGN